MIKKIIIVIFFLTTASLSYAGEKILKCDELIFKRDKPLFWGDIKYFERIDGKWESYCSNYRLKDISINEDSVKCSGLVGSVRDVKVKKKSTRVKSIFEREAEEEIEKERIRTHKIKHVELIDFLTNEYILKKYENFELQGIEKQIKCTEM